MSTAPLRLAASLLITADAERLEHVAAGIAAAVFEDNPAPLRALVREHRDRLAAEVGELAALDLEG